MVKIAIHTYRGRLVNRLSEKEGERERFRPTERVWNGHNPEKERIAKKRKSKERWSRRKRERERHRYRERERQKDRERERERERELAY